MYFLAEHPTTYWKYNDGNHYTVFDTETENSIFMTPDEIKRDIQEGIKFYGFNPLCNGVYSSSSKYFGVYIEQLAYERVNRALTGNLTRSFGLARCLYVNNKTMYVEFKDTGYIRRASYGNFSYGESHDDVYVRDYMLPTVHNRGIVGDMNFTESNPETCIAYKAWNNIMERVSHSYGDISKSYANYVNKVTGCSDSFAFGPDFYKWIISLENYDDLVYINNELDCGLDVDKGILKKHNQFYSEEMCCIVPHCINVLITGGIDSKYPIGVYKRQDTGTIVSHLKFNSKIEVPTELRRYCEFGVVSYNNNKDSQYFRQVTSKYNGCNNIPEEEWAAVGAAFLWYKKQKESRIKEVAEFFRNFKYKGKVYHLIDTRTYQALLNWKVDIND